ncbi:MAG: hypothetical protein AAB323_00185 [Pseudomonadota bacterium]
MLFLLSLYCFADTLTIDGVEYDDVIQTRNSASEDEMGGAAVFVVGKDGKLISAGKLRRKVGTVPVPVRKRFKTKPYQSNDLMKRELPTVQWRNEKIQPAQIEIFSTHQCPWCKFAEAKAHEIFDGQNIDVSVYKLDSYNPIRKEKHLKKSQAILQAVLFDLSSPQDEAAKQAFMNKFITGRSVPRISVIDANNKRWFIGGYDDFENFIKLNMSASVLPQTFRQSEAIAESDLETPMSTKLYVPGTPIQQGSILRIEIFGANDAAENLAKATFGSKVKTYDMTQPGNLVKSNAILRVVGLGNNYRMPRISVIYKGKNGLQRVFLGGLQHLQGFIDFMNRPNAKAKWKASANNSRGIWGAWHR